jgi:peptide/nickel transport system ATP-binding protein
MNERKLLLDIQDLTIHYETEAGRVRAVEHLYLELGYGETLGFVGETGAGKTTTALGVMRLIPILPAPTRAGKSFSKGRTFWSRARRKCARSVAARSR